MAEFAAQRPISGDRPPGQRGCASAAARAARPQVLAQVSEWAAQELAVALQIGQSAAIDLLTRSLTLVYRLPRTLLALDQGVIHPGHLWAFVERVAAITDPQVRARVEGELLEWVAGKVKTPAQLAERTRVLVLRHDAVGAAQRLAKALRTRGVFGSSNHEEGLSNLTAVLTTPEMALCLDALGRYADSIDDDSPSVGPHDLPSEPRTRSQKMADCLVDLILRPGETDLPPVTAHLTIVASVETMAGGDQPGEVSGHVVPAEMVRHLGQALGLLPVEPADADAGQAGCPRTDAGTSASSNDGSAAMDVSGMDVSGDGDSDVGLVPVGVGTARADATQEPMTRAPLTSMSPAPDKAILPTAGKPMPPAPRDTMSPGLWKPIPPGQHEPMFPRRERLARDNPLEPLDNRMKGKPGDVTETQWQQMLSAWVGLGAPTWWTTVNTVSSSPPVSGQRSPSDQPPPSDQSSPRLTEPPPSPPAEPPAGSAVGWAAADAALWVASRTLVRAGAEISRARSMVRTAERAAAAAEQAHRLSVGRLATGEHSVDALAGVLRKKKGAIGALLERAAGGVLADRPRIAVVDALSGTLLALTDGPQLRRLGTCDRIACTRRRAACAHDLTGRPGLAPPGPTDGYRPGRELDRFVRTRDRRCRFPGCRNRVPRGGHLDHDRRWPEGPTAVENLTGYCTPHHRGKHQARGWRHELHPDARLTVTTPTGLTITTEPPLF